jgi:hypothetical protein
MIRITAMSGGETLQATEMEVGLWSVSPLEFADFFDSATVPSSIVVLGGTQIVYPDWRSDDPMIRLYAAQYVIQRYFDLTYGEARPIEYTITGIAEQPDTDDLPPDTVF